MGVARVKDAELRGRVLPSVSEVEGMGRVPFLTDISVSVCC